MSPLAASSIKIWIKGSPALIVQHSELLSETLKATEHNIYFNHPALHVLLFFFSCRGLPIPTLVLSLWLTPSLRIVVGRVTFHLYNLPVKYSFPAGTWSLQLDFWACGSCPKSKVALLELNMQPPPFGCGVLCGVDSLSDLSYCSAE